MQTERENRKGAELGKLRICEIYSSLQGEGLLTGTPSIFVRTSGCNLRCWFCDTPFASWHPEGETISIDGIMDECARFQCEHVVITGGEPMIHAALVDLTQRLRATEQHVTIETAGTLNLPVHCDLMSISPKLSSSGPGVEAGSWQATHERRRERLEVVAELVRQYDYQLKFVVDSRQDAVEVIDYVMRLERATGLTVDRSRILLMPQGTDQQTLDKHAEWLAPWCQDQGVQFCERAHIAWFGNKRGS